MCYNVEGNAVMIMHDKKSKGLEGDSLTEEVIPKFCGEIEKGRKRKFQTRTLNLTKNKALRKQVRGISRCEHIIKTHIISIEVGYRCSNSPLFPPQPPVQIACPVFSNPLSEISPYKNKIDISRAKSQY
jgi:hypothetical protein